MPFRCPHCSQKDGLEITVALQLPPDSRSDEIILQTVACSGCGFAGLAVYEESRRGALDAESWEHTGYAVSAAGLQELAAAMRSCPQPGDPHCGCPAHQTLGTQDASGRWQGLPGMILPSSFEMRMAS